MKRIWRIMVCIGILGIFTGCSIEQRIVVEPTLYQYDAYLEQEQQAKVVELSLFFRSNTKVEQAAITSLEDIEGQGMMDPTFVSGSVKRVENNAYPANEHGDLYQLTFYLNMKANGQASFSKLLLTVNEEEYEASGSYTIDLKHTSEEFLQRKRDTGASAMMDAICLDEYEIPKDAKNIRFVSANPAIKLTSKKAEQGPAACYSWVVQFDRTYKTYGTSIRIQYELDGKTIQKYIPEIRGDYENLIF